MRKPGILTSAILGISSFVLASPLQAQGSAWNGGVPCGPHMTWWNGGWSGMILGPLLMILVPIVLIVVVLLAMRRFWPSSSAQPTVPQTPLDILRERFARGEIDKDEFEERRRTLKDGDA